MMGDVTDKYEQMAREIVGRMFRAEETPVDIITTALRTVDEAAFKRGRDAGMERGWLASIAEPATGWRDKLTFSDAERAKLRPIAETLAMLDGNAFFGTDVGDGHDFYEQYLPEADAIYQANGGDNGWAGEASFARALKENRE